VASTAKLLRADGGVRCVWARYRTVGSRERYGWIGGRIQRTGEFNNNMVWADLKRFEEVFAVEKSMLEWSAKDLRRRLVRALTTLWVNRLSGYFLRFRYLVIPDSETAMKNRYGCSRALIGWLVGNSGARTLVRFVQE
jgi:hypothetical protein